MPLTKGGSRSIERNPRRHVWSPSTRPKIGTSTPKVGLLLAQDDCRRRHLCQRCHACQVHGDFIHQAPGYLHSTTSTWPFEMWGMDLVGPISPSSSKGHRFILTITDYFSKWAEAIPLKEVKSSDVIKFVKHHVIYRFRVPRRIIHDNGP